jgi:hypothetical protein
MPSTDMDGTPILMLRLEDVIVIDECMSQVSTLMSVGRLYVQDRERFKKTYEKLNNFLDSVNQ